MQKISLAIEKDALLNNFFKNAENKLLLEAYKVTFSEMIAEKIIENLRDYFNYVLFISFVKKNLYYKSIHIKQKELNLKKKIVYGEFLLDVQQDNSWKDRVNESITSTLLANLTPLQSAIINNVYLLDRTQRDVAKQYGVTPQYINKLHRKTLEKLKISLDNDYEV